MPGMAYEPFQVIIPPGPLTLTYVRTALFEALATVAGQPAEVIRWAIVAETPTGWLIEGVAAAQHPNG